MRTTVARWGNGVRRVLARLPRHGENVWEGVPNDLFVAHLSIYEFAATRWGRGKVLDLGCGTGYGAYRLAKSVMVDRVLALDLDERNVRWASRRYRHQKLRFRREDANQLLEDRLDLVVASNVLEHLRDPDPLIANLRTSIEPEGCWIVAVPPIRNEFEMDLNRMNPFHVCNRTIEEWTGAFRTEGWRVQHWRHTHEHLERLDFSSPLRSRWEPSDFVFEPATQEQMYQLPTLSAVFELRLPEAR